MPSKQPSVHPDEEDVASPTPVQIEEPVVIEVALPRVYLTVAINGQEAGRLVFEVSVAPVFRV